MSGGSGVRWLLMLGFGLSLLVVVGVLVHDRLAAPVAPPPTTEVGDGGVTARQAFAPAAELAAQWQEDAHLAAISGRWSAVGMQPGDQVEWTFQFFSPSTQRLAIIVAVGEEARVLREGLSPYMVPTFSTEKWRVDSDEALRTWWESGGSTVVARRPDTDLAVQLHMPDGGGDHPIWTVVGWVVGTRSAFTVVVDATSGAQVE